MTPKETVQKFVEYFNAADTEALASLYADEAVNHQAPNLPVAGKAAITAMFKEEFAAAKMVCIMEHIFEDGEWAILEWRDPKGLRGCGFFHVPDGKIVFQRGYWDKLSFLKQIAADAPPVPTRRRDREITDRMTLRQIICNNNQAVISMTDGVTPYGVMLNYAPLFDGKRLTMYFHCALDGHKIDILRQNPAVSVFVNDVEKTKIVNAGSNSAKWTTHYRSVILSGTIKLLTDYAQKDDAIRIFMRHYTDEPVEFAEAVLERTMILKLNVDRMTGKQNPGPQS